MSTTTLTNKDRSVRPYGNPQDAPPSADSGRSSPRHCLRHLGAQNIARYQQGLVLAIPAELYLISFQSPTKPWVNHTSVKPKPQAEPLGNRSEKGRCIPLPCARTVPTATPACHWECSGARSAFSFFKLKGFRYAGGAVLRRAMFDPAERVARSPVSGDAPRPCLSITSKSSVTWGLVSSINPVKRP